MLRILETTLTGLLVVACVVVAMTVARREFFDTNDAGRGIVAQSPSRVDNWDEILAAGSWIGDSAAKVKVVEFGDFECPFCRRFHEAFAAVHSELGREVALLFVAYPIPTHRFAKPAAFAAECAARQGHWADYHDALFAKQDSLGLRTWTDYAVDANVPDTLEFALCVKRTTSSSRIDNDVALGAQLGVRGTPTVIVNGWRYAVPPYDSLGRIVQRFLDPNFAPEAMAPIAPKISRGHAPF